MTWRMAGTYPGYTWSFVWVTDGANCDLYLPSDLMGHGAIGDTPINLFTEVI